MPCVICISCWCPVGLQKTRREQRCFRRLLAAGLFLTRQYCGPSLQCGQEHSTSHTLVMPPDSARCPCASNKDAYAHTGLLICHAFPGWDGDLHSMPVHEPCSSCMILPSLPTAPCLLSTHTRVLPVCIMTNTEACFDDVKSASVCRPDVAACQSACLPLPFAICTFQRYNLSQLTNTLLVYRWH